MGHSKFLAVLLVSYILLLPFVHGNGIAQFGDPALVNRLSMHRRTPTRGYPRKMMAWFEVDDYSEPEPNTNPKNGYLFSPPSHDPAPSPGR